MKYRPVNVLPADWDRVKDFCRQAVLAYEPPTAAIAAQLLSTVALFVLWATKEEHAPLDYDGVFHPSLMGRYLRTRVSDKKSGAFKTLRSRLFRVASAVTSIDHHKTKRDTTVVPVHEYTAGELAELEGWAATRNTDERRRYAYITLALMGGAGLSMSEALGVRGADVRHDVSGYTVRVSGRRARVVPVHADWERYLDEPSTHFVDDEHVLFNGQTLHGRGTTLRTLYRGPHPAPNPQWLRDSRLLQLLRTLPLSIIMQAVGTSDLVRFRRYIDTAHLDFDQWHDAVRNPAAYVTSMDTTRDSDGAYGPATKRRDDVESVDAKVDEAPSSTQRPRPRDPATFNDYRRRPPRNSDEQTLTLTTDSTAVPAGTPAVPFKRTRSAEQHHGEALRPAGKEVDTPRRLGALEADWTPKRPRKKSRYESLPPSVTHRPVPPETLTAVGDQTDADTAMFSTLRAALLAEARRSARGEKR